MKIIFAGTPEFAATALESLVNAGHEIVLVLTQPDRPSGRGLKLQESEVKTYALSQGIEVIQPQSLKLGGKYPEEAQMAHEKVKSVEYDVIVVAAYGLILPKSFLDLGRCINIHGSLLPRWRGAAPIHRAIEYGDAHTGITIMEMDVGLDTGDMLLVEAISIASDDTTESLHDKLAVLGGKLINEAINDLDNLWDNKIPQPTEGMSYAEKLTKEEGSLNINESAISLERKIRAFNPFPGASLELDGVKIKIWKAEIVTEADIKVDLQNIQLGQVIYADKNNGIVIHCGEGFLRLLELQKVGSKKVSYKDFINGHQLLNKSCT
jgi:methionyl-tRNA formyltransferase